jgi:hypothetical protein
MATTVCRARGGKTRWATRPGQIKQGIEARARRNVRLWHQRAGLPERKAFAPLLHQIPRRAYGIGNRLIGPLFMRQQHDVHSAHRLLGRFPGPLQRFEGLLFGGT